jgi:hypothetical protein
MAWHKSAHARQKLNSFVGSSGMESRPVSRYRLCDLWESLSAHASREHSQAGLTAAGL